MEQPQLVVDLIGQELLQWKKNLLSLGQEDFMLHAQAVQERGQTVRVLVKVPTVAEGGTNF